MLIRNKSTLKFGHLKELKSSPGQQNSKAQQHAATDDMKQLVQ